MELTKTKINEKFKPLYKSLKRYFFISGGRGSGKSYAIADFLLRLTYEKGHVILFSRYTMISAHISIIPEFTDKIDLYGLEKDFDITRTEITNILTGSRIIFRGIKTGSGHQTAALKSIQGLTTWVLDEAEELPDETIFDKIDDSIRQVDVQNRIIFVLNPSFKYHWIYKTFVDRNREDVEYIHTSYLDNIENLSDSFIEKAEKTKLQNPLKYDNTYMGEWIDEIVGALWRPEIIQKIKNIPELERIVVGVDPPASKEGDAAGIITAGIDKEKNIYVLSDRSGNYTPGQWGTITANEAEIQDADCIVAEKNQGGEMVEYVIRQYDEIIRLKLVHAKKGKALRAEPVVSFYEQGKIFHTDGLIRLENEMLTWVPGEGESPNRVDALVYSVLELIEPKVNTNVWV